MRTRLIILAIGFTGVLNSSLFCAFADLEVSAGVTLHSTSEFYEPLASGGTWVEVGSYGRCWRPAGVAAGWRPYCDGYWEWTDCGWYWISDEPWAWACYHYGTWVNDPHNGWVWIPGVEWAPAWVCWRTGADYIGWAPCGPGGAKVDPSFYVFVQSAHFQERVRPGGVIVNNTAIFAQTSEIGGGRRENRKFDGREQAVMVNEGPRVELVEKATGKKLVAEPVRAADQDTFASIPEKIKHQNSAPTAEQQKPAPPTPRANPELPNTLPLDRTIPQAAPQAPVPDQQDQNKNEDKDKDHGHDNP